jgi:endo-1,4-beta-xylanase
MGTRARCLVALVALAAAIVPAATAAAGSLRDAATRRGFYVGAAVNMTPLGGERRYRRTLAREFNVCVAENAFKFENVHPAPGVYDFGDTDALARFATKHGMRLRGHTLVWYQQLPDWVAHGTFTRDEAIAVLREHITTLVARYKGEVWAWDVVNEAIADSGAGPRDTIFRQKLGDSYLADAFRLARQADPQALLFYNDYAGEGLNAKSDRIYDLVRGLKAQGVPIDGVGLQMHITAWNPPGESAVASNMRRLAELGLLVNISEMDVRIRDLPGTAQSKLDAQKAVYKSMVSVCVAEPRCDAVTFWGFTDAHSWIDSQYGADDPLLFDEQYAPKPAFYGVFDAFMRR